MSTFQIEAGLDTGPVLGARSHPIGPRDTAGDLLEALADLGAPLLVETLDQIEEGTATAVPQPNTGISHAPRVTSAEARVDWHAPANTVDQQIRATTPAPGAWTTLQGRRLKIAPVCPEPGMAAEAPGSVRPVAEGVVVGTGSHPVRLTRVAPAGKGWMDATDWLRGARLVPGSRLGGHDDD